MSLKPLELTTWPGKKPHKPLAILNYLTHVRVFANVRQGEEHDIHEGKQIYEENGRVRERFAKGVESLSSG